MKLRDLEIFVVAPPAPGWGGRYWIFTKVTTDNGIVGYGECYASTVGPKAMRAVIEDVFERHMMGESPENIELMYRRVYSSGFTQRPDPTVMGAFAGLEIACWDILGKARNRPVWALLGGKINQKIRSYTYLYPQPGEDASEFWVNADMTAQAAARYVDMGFTAVKFDPAGPYTIRGGHEPAMSDITRSVEFCRKIREAVGDRADLLFGTHGQFTTPGAIRMLEKASAELPDFLFGLGTVLDAETARAGILSGAKFIVTPALRPDVITLCKRYSVPIFSGAFTPTEIINAWEAGADAAKIFPAEFFGPGYIKSVKAPLPHVEMLPTGGVNESNVGEFLKAGAFAVAAGSSLVDAKAMKEKNWAAITAKAKAFVAAVAAAK
jgi:Entner-Doudoroff aldolase